ncbi:MAG: hypothetical protein K0R34_2932 [Herbinix sp.]|jgi:hypothetical protein|nr:hypothetical protein [Herbinix sp.]
MGDMGSQSMMGYASYDGFLAGLLGLLIKILFIILIISILVGVTQWIKKNFFVNVNLKQYINQNPVTKLIVGTIAVIFILFLLMYFLSYLSGGGYGYGMGSMAGFGTFNIFGIIVFILKLLTFFFVITFIVSLIAYLMKQLGISNLFQTINKTQQDTATQGNSTFMSDEKDKYTE